jgi:hypothetical protein
VKTGMGNASLEEIDAYLRRELPAAMDALERAQREGAYPFGSGHRERSKQPLYRTVGHPNSICTCSTPVSFSLASVPLPAYDGQFGHCKPYSKVASITQPSSTSMAGIISYCPK